ncbi:MATE family efflux transporter [Clostridioides difficile]|uniref:MATE family efflux transporter n=1 Tax=Clostridioides difficile TaxID=1496 RepID=UPI002E8E1904|nr:MATE family efflux transporter [Clostridioides difficile]
MTSLGSLVVFGFIKGFQPIAGYNFGSKNYDRLHIAIKTSILWTTIFCVVLGLILILFPKSIISQFTSGDILLIENGSKALRANGFSFMLFGFYTVYSTLFLALGKAKEGGFLGMCRQGVCFIPIILIIPVFYGLNGILYAQPIADLMAAIIAGFMSIRLHKELNLLKINGMH